MNAYDEYGNLLVYGVCSRCKETTRFFSADTGIGAYGYGDANGWDKNESWLSDCCERDMLGEPTDAPDEEGAAYWEDGVFHESIAALESLFDFVENKMFTSEETK